MYAHTRYVDGKGSVEKVRFVRRGGWGSVEQYGVGREGQRHSQGQGPSRVSHPPPHTHRRNEAADHYSHHSQRSKAPHTAKGIWGYGCGIGWIRGWGNMLRRRGGSRRRE